MGAAKFSFDYVKPKQSRAIETEQRFLDALDQCLSVKSYRETTIQDIAEAAGLHRGAFIKRFGSKQMALFRLYDRYKDRASEVLNDILSRLSAFASFEELAVHMSETLERIQRRDFSANRAMNEMFLVDLKTDPYTVQIFKETVDVMRAAQSHFFEPGTYSDIGAFAATQILVTSNYFYVLNAMPALPKSPRLRHRLIGQWMVQAATLSPSAAEDDF